MTLATVLFIGLVSIWFSDPARLASAAAFVTAGLAIASQRFITAVAGYSAREELQRGRPDRDGWGSRRRRTPHGCAPRFSFFGGQTWHWPLAARGPTQSLR